FLEGNFFVDLEPGSPSSPVLESGDSLPASQTAGPVQFDQLLTSFNYDTRRGLQIGLKEFAGELYRGEVAGGLSSWLRFNAIVGYSGLNSEGGPAAGVSNFQTDTVQKGFLHANAYPKASSPGEVAQCAAGNEVTRGKSAPGNVSLTPAPLIGNPEGLGGAKTEDTQPVNKDVVK
ncbi:MAG: hypothetical protein JHC87_02675, partial [Thermoleophilaceae bacterium]|nr:hypothetical protein [Thermoleophilaceae bacterium]